MTKRKLSCPGCGQKKSFWFLRPKTKCRECGAILCTNSRLVTVILVLLTSFLVFFLHVFVFLGHPLAVIIEVPIALVVASFLGSALIKIWICDDDSIDKNNK